MVTEKEGCKLVYLATATSWKIRISPVVSLDTIYFKQSITKVLSSLRGCAGWSAPLLFANPEDRYSRVEAQMSLLRIQSFLFHTLYSLCFTHYTVSAPLCYARQYSWLRICYFFSWLKGWWMVPGSSLQQPYYTETIKTKHEIKPLAQIKMPAK